MLKSPSTCKAATMNEGDEFCSFCINHTIAVRVENHTAANYLKPAFYTELRGSTYQLTTAFCGRELTGPGCNFHLIDTTCRKTYLTAHARTTVFVVFVGFDWTMQIGEFSSAFTNICRKRRWFPDCLRWIESVRKQSCV